MCGKINISQLITVLGYCDLFITNDSGPLHLAMILDIPTISFFGPETPVTYGPQGEKHTVFYEDIYCSPCINIYNAKSTKCTNNICLKRVSIYNMCFILIWEKYFLTIVYVSLFNKFVHL